MPLQYTNTGTAIPHLPAIPAGNRQASQNAIALIQFADLGRGAGTVRTSGVARVDIQGRTATHVNVQVQIGGNTVAAALLDLAILNIANVQNQQGGANAAISALNRSLDSGTTWQVDGTLP